MISRSSSVSSSIFRVILFQAVACNVAGELAGFVLDGFADARKEEVIAVLERKLALVDEEGKHTPVDQVGAVTFGGVLVGDVCPAAQNLLAGSRLLSGGTVAGFYSENGGTNAHVCLVYIRIFLMYAP